MVIDPATAAMLKTTESLVKTPGFLSGFGWLVFPYFMRKAAEHKVVGIVTAQIRGQQTLEQALMDGTIITPPGTSQEQILASIKNMCYHALIKQQRRENIARMAYDQLPPELQENPSSFDEDFEALVYRLAEDCASDKAQKKWASLIAHECMHPGTFTLRTINILYSLSSEDASLLRKYGPYIFDGIIFFKYSEEYKSDIKLLHDSGIAKEYREVVSIEIKSGENCVFTRNKKRYYIKNNSNDNVSLRGTPLTREGKAISSLDSVMTGIEVILQSLQVHEIDLTINPSKGVHLDFSRIEYGEVKDNLCETCTRVSDVLMYG
ncbi:DUF2806 domain-containing protein [Desulfovibrio desulfuricans]|uniref:DUF2806 domain-containing protein n=1 Tax=Desulfovibrio desulfuricans TaxID=876 RepID=UPI00177DEADE|nr:DUF2806 domain-containing protein [Desulfovibrio desulfuricans]MBD8894759.1 DUF2806 domain-containing protein [Desulfovibrio desulfuricans]